MAVPITKREVLDWASKRGIAITHTQDALDGDHHVHADIEGAGLFRAHDLHNLALWAAPEAPNWKQVGRELVDADYGPCTIPNCPYCIEAPHV